MKGLFRKYIALGLIALAIEAGLFPSAVAAQENRFSEYDIRVIRPRYFQKRQRYEVGAEFIAVVNDTFVYTLLASGVLSYHLTESWGIEGALAIGESINRSEKDILFDEFEIKTEVFRTKYFGELSIMYTPIYGKIQLPEGRLIYFDTFVNLGAGMTGVEWQYSDFCQQEEGTEVPGDTTNTYPNIVFGIGQRIFRDEDTAIRWGLRDHLVFYDTADSSCDANNPTGGSKTRGNVTMQIGLSKFF